MDRRIVPSMLLGLILICSELFGQNWTLSTPDAGTEYKDNEDVTGAGMADDTDNTGADFYFEQQDPNNQNNYNVRGSASVQGYTDEAGMFRWSQTLDPSDEQPNNLWPTSPLGGMMIPVGDYRTRIDGSASSGESHFHTVVD